jgi:RimJ/RimL family protein N-acetyltransferase
MSSFSLSWIRSAEALIQWAGDTFRWPLDAQALTAFAEAAPTHVWKQFEAVEPTTGEVVGHCEIRIGPRGTSGQIARVVVAPQARGRSIGEAMVRALVRTAFDEFGVHRVDLNVYDFNPAAIATYERVGSIKEGLLREVTPAADGIWNAYVMGLLEPDFWAVEAKR